MAIDLRTFASGDTDYIAKLNENYATIKAAIDQLQVLSGAAGAGSSASAGYMMDALFNHADALIGTNSYLPTYSGGSLFVNPGAMYLADTQTVVQWFAGTMINFGGSTARTYYVVIDASGLPTKMDTAEAGAAWSVQWTGSAFIGQPKRVAPTFFDTNEATASRISQALAGPASPPLPAIEFNTLDERLEAAEERILTAQDTADAALESAGITRTRKVGCTVTAIGVVGAIQLDFYGTITGWSVIGDAVGTLTVEVDRKASSAPPAAPGIPNTTTDKISGSTPITLASAQSASRATISGWNVSVNQWDVLQFNCTALGTLTKATLYLLIDEITSP
jgi:hypothetical protein